MYIIHIIKKPLKNTRKSICLLTTKINKGEKTDSNYKIDYTLARIDKNIMIMFHNLKKLFEDFFKKPKV